MTLLITIGIILAEVLFLAGLFFLVLRYYRKDREPPATQTDSATPDQNADQDQADALLLQYLRKAIERTRQCLAACPLTSKA